ncbi:MAG: type II toxin-antitoxin system prevent-host-death family antitoxin [Chthoniobacterales bacterium]
MKLTPSLQQIGAYEAKTNLSRLLRQTRAGKSFIITQRGKPVAELKPAPVKRGKAGRGDMKGKIWVADDFCEPIGEMREYME